jgi:tRNA pseudouridine32 synthase/23S rRNA pseudouridine746 synthase
VGPVDQIALVAQSDSWVVIDKPAGVLSVPGKGPEKQACAASWVREKFPHATGPIIVHRLDMDTSGLLLLALTPEAQRLLSRQFEDRLPQKAYTAVATGLFRDDAGTIDAPIRLDIERRPYHIVDPTFGRSAQTHYRVLSRDPHANTTRLELTPITGRTHQLRVHCLHLGHPLVGDPLYGTRQDNQRLLLHAHWLCFNDPTTGERIEVHSPVPF